MTWWQKAIIYEFYVDKFAGNFKNLAGKLDYLANLGVDTLWMLPHYPSPMVDGGYDVADYYGVRGELGTLADFDALVAAAHGKNLKVMIDMVLNHTSSEHPWFAEARSSKDNPKRNWYLWSDNRNGFAQAFVHFGDLKDGKNWIANPQTGDYYYATFYPQQPDLNWDNPEVADEMTAAMDFWLERGVDGFRLDAISRLIKRENTNCFGLPETHQQLKKIRAHIDAKFKDRVLLAESGGWPDEARQFFGNSDECQTVLNFPLSVRMLDLAKNPGAGSAEDLKSETGNIPDNCKWAGFLTSHDSVDLWFLQSGEKIDRLRMQIDPLGIFANGESVCARLGEIAKGNAEEIIYANDLLLSLPVVPIIYYGNEIGMRNQNLTEKPPDSREYVRGQFDWDEAERQMKNPESVLNHLKSSIANRRSQN